MPFPDDAAFNPPRNQGVLVQALKDLNTEAKRIPLIPNPVLNGSFSIAQTGTSFTNPSSGATTLDAWGTDDSAGSSSVFSQQTSLGLPGFEFALRCQRTAASANTAVRRLTQVFETRLSRRYQNSPIVLSFYARAGANYSATGGALISRISTGTGTDQSLASVLAATWTTQSNSDQQNLLSSDWQRFKHTIQVGPTVTQLAVGLRFTPVGTAGGSDYFECTGFQIDNRTESADYLEMPFAIELMRCQRRRYKTFAYATTPVQNAGASTGALRHLGGAAGQVQVTWDFPVEMRVAPTITTYNPAAANASFRNVTDSTDSAVTATTDVTTRRLTIVGTTAAGNAGDNMAIHALAEANF